MEQWLLRFCFILLPACLCAHRHAKTADPAILRAKNVLISAFDRNLPRITLEYFLTYESGGAPVEWEVIECRERSRSSGAGLSGDFPTRVQATIDDVHAQRNVAVVVDVRSSEEESSGSIGSRNVTITDENGRVHSVRLISLPAVIHRLWPKPHPIRDLSPIVGARASLPTPPSEYRRSLNAENTNRQKLLLELRKEKLFIALRPALFGTIQTS
jgi:hypothetical protein